MNAFYVIGVFLVLVLGWFKLLDWLEKRTQREAARRAEDYKARAQESANSS